MLTDLAIPFQDTRAGALSWWLGDGPPALGELVLPGPHGRLALRLLGASHQVVAQVGDTQLHEVVACGGPVGGLPPTEALALDSADYRFASSTTRYDVAGLARVARDLRRRHTGSADGLVGAYPGSPHALTVLHGSALPRGWRWRTWHVYPGSGEVVRTHGSLVAR